MGIVYLIHFKSKLHHAQHYVGWCNKRNLGRRINHHMSGTGSKLMAAVTDAGIEWHVVRTWDNVDRNFERRIKNRHNTKTFCPECNQEVKCA